MSWVEWAGFLTGALCVYLVVRQHVANFPVGIANCCFFAVLFFDAGLYADAGLQLVFLGLGARGWWLWLHGAADRGPLQIRPLPPEVAVRVNLGVGLPTVVLTRVRSRTCSSSRSGRCWAFRCPSGQNRPG